VTIGGTLPEPGAPNGVRASDAAVEVQDVRVQYEGAALPALGGVSLRVPAGARVALLGANGAGKSTLLKAIVGLTPVQSGTIRIQGAPFPARRRQVAYLAQQNEQDWRFPISVQGLVMTGRYVHLGWLRRTGKQDRELAMTALERLGVAELAQRQIGQLSGGQRQRVLLARALVQRAEIVLLDEPFTAVDTETRAVLTAVLAELNREGTTLLVATHAAEPDDFDEMIYLHSGRIMPANARLQDLQRMLAAADA
jgi:manganese/zinc/iron transport system ATP- binding protein